MFHIFQYKFKVFKEAQPEWGGGWLLNMVNNVACESSQLDVNGDKDFCISSYPLADAAL